MTQTFAMANASGTKLPLPLVDKEQNQTVVTSSNTNLFTEKSTTASSGLRLLTMQSLLAEFDRIGHKIDYAQFSSLEEVVDCMVAMASSNAANVVHLSSLDPGIGKTSACIHFVRNLVALPEYSEVGVLICLPRLDEVKRLFFELGLDNTQVALKTSDPEVNALTKMPSHEAQVLITTHEQVRRLTKRHETFGNIESLHYRGQPRQVRIWDEAYAPRSVIQVSSDDINALVSRLRSPCPQVAAKLEDLNKRLQTQAAGPFEVGEVFSAFPPGVMADVWAVVGERTTSETTLRHLMELENRTARKADDNTLVSTLFSWSQVIPEDFGPALVFDASGRVRSTYTAFEQNGELCRLSSAPKDYSTVNVHLHKIASSRSAWHECRPELVSYVAGIMKSKPTARYLVISHKDVGAKKLKPELERAAPGVKFDVLRWGQHQGTNAYADYDHIIVASTFFIPEGAYEALAYASLGLDVSQPLPEGFLSELKQGELADLLLQGVCRGALRGCNAGMAVPCEVHILASARCRMTDLVPRLFPGCKIKVSAARKPKVTPKIQQAIDHCKDRIAQSATFISITELMDASGVTNRANFNRQVLNKPAFQDFVRDAGLQPKEGQRVGSVCGFTVPAFPPFDPYDDNIAL